MLLLHLSCHGQRDKKGDLYFEVGDTDPTAPASTGIKASFISALMDESRARRVVLFLDCCYSGAFELRARTTDPDVDVRRNFAGQGRVVMTASTALQLAYDQELHSRRTGEPSVFTSAVVRGLTTGEADLDGDGHISVNELFAYVEQAVRDIRPDQSPTLSVDSVQGAIYLATSPRGPITEAPPQMIEGDTIRRVLAALVESPHPLDHPQLRAAARWPVAEVTAMAERMPNAGMESEVDSFLQLAAHGRSTQELRALVIATSDENTRHWWLTDVVAALPAPEVAALAEALDPRRCETMLKEVAAVSSVSRLIELADALRDRSLEYEVAAMFREAAFRHRDRPSLVAGLEERPRDLAYVFSRPNDPIAGLRGRYSGPVTAPRSITPPESQIILAAVTFVLILGAGIPSLLPKSYQQTGASIALAISLALTAAYTVGFGRARSAAWLVVGGGAIASSVLLLTSSEVDSWIWMGPPTALVLGSAALFLALKRYDGDQIRAWYLKTIDRCGLGAQRTLFLMGQLEQDAGRIEDAIGWYEQAATVPYAGYRFAAMAAIGALERERQAHDRARRWYLRLTEQFGAHPSAAMLALGEMDAEAGQPETALDWFTKAIHRQFPPNSIFYEYWNPDADAPSGLLADLALPPTAIWVLLWVRYGTPVAPTAMFRAGQLEESRGDKEAAANWYRAASRFGSPRHKNALAEALKRCEKAQIG
ncbi:hypothetical protein ACTIVE_1648 [Actinomadura verrucosospora]|uniref:EF-hand domain-containing protein n=1 Tax=Actinomadura verrucosospora TaxID=46165 RepID=A0A7D3VVZ7_ACTVE|nr:hypothetical protein ACTIVE_1648 [Actinomadura verrucosospora]